VRILLAALTLTRPRARARGRPLPRCGRGISGALTALTFGLAAAGAGEVELPAVEVEGTAFKVTTSDGRVLRSPDLVGAVLTIARGDEPTRLRIDAVERDPVARRGEVWLHDLSLQAADGSWQKLCQPAADGRRQGFPLAGRSHPADGHFEMAEAGVFELTCTSGAEGKCVRFGYLPWAGEPEFALYNACLHMVRADYCGDGTPHTRDGVPIDPYDKLGIRTRALAAGMEFEAAWGADGAVCARRVRVPEVYSLDALRAECPRLLSEDIGEGCTEARASQNPAALLMNRSPKRR
jgi:hypothetical protein